MYCFNIQTCKNHSNAIYICNIGYSAIRGKTFLKTLYQSLEFYLIFDSESQMYVVELEIVFTHKIVKKWG